MDHRHPVIRSIADAEAMHANILSGVARTAGWLRGFVGEPLELLRALRFLGGRQPAQMTLAVLMRRFPVLWSAQRSDFCTPLTQPSRLDT